MATSITYSAPAQPEIRIPSLASKIEIPDAFGSVIDRYVPDTPSKATVIHIQDAHSSNQAQASIQNILHHLHEAYGVRLIFLEGVMEEIKPELMLYYKSPEWNKKLAGIFAKESLIGGTELFAIENYYGKKDLSVYGIEDAPLYDKNLDEFRAVLKEKKQTEDFLEKLKSEILSQSTRVFNKDLKSFFREWAFQQEVPANALRNLGILEKQAKISLNLNFNVPETQLEWPQLVRVFRLKGLEGKVNAGQVRKEKAAMQAWMKQKGVSDDAFGRLLDAVGNTSRLDNARLTAEKFYHQAAVKGFRFETFPELSKAIGAVILRNEIQASGLFAEIEKLTQLLLECLARNNSEKEWLVVYHDYLLLRKLFALELNRDQYGILKTRTDEILPSVMLKRMGQKENTSFDALYKKAFSFYKTATEREKGMLERVSEKMKASGKETSVLITGGFHSEGLKQDLKSRGIAYVEIQPHLSDLADENNYLKLMLGENSINHTSPLDSGIYRSRTAARMIRKADALAGELGRVHHIEVLAPRRPAKKKKKAETPKRRPVMKPKKRSEMRSVQEGLRVGHPTEPSIWKSLGDHPLRHMKKIDSDSLNLHVLSDGTKVLITTHAEWSYLLEVLHGEAKLWMLPKKHEEDRGYFFLPVDEIFSYEIGKEEKRGIIRKDQTIQLPFFARDENKNLIVDPKEMMWMSRINEIYIYPSRSEVRTDERKVFDFKIPKGRTLRVADGVSLKYLEGASQISINARGQYILEENFWDSREDNDPMWRNGIPGLLNERLINAEQDTQWVIGRPSNRKDRIIVKIIDVSQDEITVRLDLPKSFTAAPFIVSSNMLRSETRSTKKKKSPAKRKISQLASAAMAPEKGVADLIRRLRSTERVKRETYGDDDIAAVALYIQALENAARVIPFLESLRSTGSRRFRANIKWILDKFASQRSEMRFIRLEDQAKSEEWLTLMKTLGFELFDDSGKIKYADNYEIPELKFNFVVIPHGETKANADDRFHGGDADSDISVLIERGIRQAVDGSPKLKELIGTQGWRFEDLVLLRSYLSRTDRTGSFFLTMLEALNPNKKSGSIDLKVAENAEEIHFGSWHLLNLENLSGEELRWAESYKDFNAFSRASKNFSFSKFERENYLMFLARVRRLIEQWNKKYEGKTVVLFGHGTFATALKSLFRSPDIASEGYLRWRLSIPPRGEPYFIPSNTGAIVQRSKIEDIDIEFHRADIAEVPADAVMVGMNTMRLPDSSGVQASVTNALMKAKGFVPVSQASPLTSAQKLAFPLPENPIAHRSAKSLENLGRANISDSLRRKKIETQAGWDRVVSAMIHDMPDNATPESVTNGILNALILADKNEIQSITIPAIGTGIKAVSVQDMTKWAFEAFHQFLSEDPKNLKKVKFVLSKESKFKAFFTVFSSLLKTRESIATQLKELIAEKLDRTPQTIQGNFRLGREEGLDSLDLSELVMNVEEEFDIVITKKEALRIKNINQLVLLLMHKLSTRSETRTVVKPVLRRGHVDIKGTEISVAFVERIEAEGRLIASLAFAPRGYYILPLEVYEEIEGDIHLLNEVEERLAQEGFLTAEPQTSFVIFKPQPSVETPLKFTVDAIGREQLLAEVVPYRRSEIRVAQQITRPKVILFDVDNMLVPAPSRQEQYSRVAKELSAFAETKGAPAKLLEWDVVRRDIFYLGADSRKPGTPVVKVAHGLMSGEEYMVLVNRKLKELYGVDFDFTPEQWYELNYVERTQGPEDKNEVINEALDELKYAFGFSDMGILSDRMAGDEAFFAGLIGKKFDDFFLPELTFLSSELGSTKEDGNIFPAVLEKLRQIPRFKDIQPQDILLVDDRDKNLQTARKNGFQAVKYIYGQEKPLADVLKPYFEIAVQYIVDHYHPERITAAMGLLKRGTDLTGGGNDLLQDPKIPWQQDTRSRLDVLQRALQILNRPNRPVKTEQYFVPERFKEKVQKARTPLTMARIFNELADLPSNLAISVLLFDPEVVKTMDAFVDAKDTRGVLKAYQKAVDKHYSVLLLKFAQGLKPTDEEIRMLAATFEIDPVQNIFIPVAERKTSEGIVRERVVAMQKAWTGFSGWWLDYVKGSTLETIPIDTMWRVYLPLSQWIVQEKRAKRPDSFYMMGFYGSQGRGKTVTSRALVPILNTMLDPATEGQAVARAVDDYYKSKADRELLRPLGYDPGVPGVSNRGPAGTHYTEWILRNMEEFEKSTPESRIETGEYDKGIDDLARTGPFVVNGKVGVFLFDGWFTGAETDFDISAIPEGTFPHTVAKELQGDYKKIFDRMDGLWAFDKPPVEEIKANRRQQEALTEKLTGKRAMNDEQVGIFVDYFVDKPWYADVTSYAPPMKNITWEGTIHSNRRMKSIVRGGRSEARNIPKPQREKLIELLKDQFSTQEGKSFTRERSRLEGSIRDGINGGEEKIGPLAIEEKFHKDLAHAAEVLKSYFPEEDIKFRLLPLRRPGEERLFHGVYRQAVYFNAQLKVDESLIHQLADLILSRWNYDLAEDLLSLREDQIYLIRFDRLIHFLEGMAPEFPKITEEESKRRLNAAEATDWYAWLDDIDGNIADKNAEVSEEMVRFYQDEINAGKMRGMVSGRALIIPSTYRSSGIHDMEEVAVRIRSGIKHEHMQNFILFPENGTYAHWWEWNEERGQLYPREKDLVKHYGLVPENFTMDEAYRNKFAREIESYLAENGFPDAFKLKEPKRYGFAGIVNDENPRYKGNPSKTADEMTAKVKEFLAAHDEYKHLFDAVATSISVDIQVKGLDKMLAVRYTAERFGLDEDTIITSDDKALPTGNGHAYTNRPGGLSTYEYNPRSPHQIPLVLATGKTNLAARLEAGKRIKIKPILVKKMPADSSRSEQRQVSVEKIRVIAAEFVDEASQLLPYLSDFYDQLYNGYLEGSAPHFDAYSQHLLYALNILMRSNGIPKMMPTAFFIPTFEFVDFVESLKNEINRLQGIEPAPRFKPGFYAMMQTFLNDEERLRVLQALHAFARGEILTVEPALMRQLIARRIVGSDETLSSVTAVALLPHVKRELRKLERSESRKHYPVYGKENLIAKLEKISRKQSDQYASQIEDLKRALSGKAYLSHIKRTAAQFKRTAKNQPEVIDILDHILERERAKGPLAEALSELNYRGFPQFAHLLQNLYPMVLPYLDRSRHGNPVDHTLMVVQFITSILLGEQATTAEIKRGIVAALLHDAGFAFSKEKKIRTSDIENAETPAKKEELRRAAIHSRQAHMETGAKLAGEILNRYNQRYGTVFTKQDIREIQRIIRHHDDPSIQELEAKNDGRWLFKRDDRGLMFQREADRLSMITQADVEQNLDRNRKRGIRASAAKVFLGLVARQFDEYDLYEQAFGRSVASYGFQGRTLYRTYTGYLIFSNNAYVLYNRYNVPESLRITPAMRSESRKWDESRIESPEAFIVSSFTGPIVIGGSGFVGSHLSEALAADGSSVAIPFRARGAASFQNIVAAGNNLNAAEIGGRLHAVETKNLFDPAQWGSEIPSPEKLKQFIGKSTVIYHLAAQPNPKPAPNQSVEDYIVNTLVTNVFLTKLLARIARETGKPMVYGSSGHIFAMNPLFEKPIEGIVTEETEIPLYPETVRFMEKVNQGFDQYLNDYLAGKTVLSPADFAKEYLQTTLIESRLPELPAVTVFQLFEKLQTLDNLKKNEKEKAPAYLEQLRTEYPADLTFGLYAVSKILSEQDIMNLPAGTGAVLRFANIYGPRMRMDSPRLFVTRLLNGQPVGYSPHSRDYLSYKDAVPAIGAIGKALTQREWKQNELVHVNSGKGPYTIKMLLDAAQEAVGTNVNANQMTDIPDLLLPPMSNAKMIRLTGHTPQVSLVEGLFLIADDLTRAEMRSQALPFHFPDRLIDGFQKENIPAYLQIQARPGIKTQDPDYQGLDLKKVRAIYPYNLARMKRIQVNKLLNGVVGGFSNRWYDAPEKWTQWHVDQIYQILSAGYLQGIKGTQNLWEEFQRKLKESYHFAQKDIKKAQEFSAEIFRLTADFEKGKIDQRSFQLALSKSKPFNNSRNAQADTAIKEALKKAEGAMIRKFWKDVARLFDWIPVVSEYKHLSRAFNQIRKISGPIQTDGTRYQKAALKAAKKYAEIEVRNAFNNRSESRANQPSFDVLERIVRAAIVSFVKFSSVTSGTFENRKLGFFTAIDTILETLNQISRIAKGEVQEEALRKLAADTKQSYIFVLRELFKGKTYGDDERTIRLQAATLNEYMQAEGNAKAIAKVEAKKPEVEEWSIKGGTPEEWQVSMQKALIGLRDKMKEVLLQDPKGEEKSAVESRLVPQIKSVAEAIEKSVKKFGGLPEKVKAQIMPALLLMAQLAEDGYLLTYFSLPPNQVNIQEYKALKTVLKKAEGSEAKKAAVDRKRPTPGNLVDRIEGHFRTFSNMDVTIPKKRIEELNLETQIGDEPALTVRILTVFKESQGFEQAAVTSLFNDVLYRLKEQMETNDSLSRLKNKKLRLEVKFYYERDEVFKALEKMTDFDLIYMTQGFMNGVSIEDAWQKKFETDDFKERRVNDHYLKKVPAVLIKALSRAFDRSETRMNPADFREFLRGLNGWRLISSETSRQMNLTLGADFLSIVLKDAGGWMIHLSSDDGDKLYLRWKRGKKEDQGFFVNGKKIPGFEDNDPLIHIRYDDLHPQIQLTLDKTAETAVTEILQNVLVIPGGAMRGHDPIGYKIDFREVSRRSEVRQKMKVLLADLPGKMDGILNLAKRFPDQIEILEPKGMGSKPAELQAIIEKEKPDVIFIRSGAQLKKENRAVLEAIAKIAYENPEWKPVILRGGAETGNVDSKIAKELGIILIRTHGNANSVANLMLRFLLAFLRLIKPRIFAEGKRDFAQVKRMNQALNLFLSEFVQGAVSAEKSKRGLVLPEQANFLFGAAAYKKKRDFAAAFKNLKIALAGFGKIPELIIRKLQTAPDVFGVKLPVKVWYDPSRNLAAAQAQAEALGVEIADKDWVINEANVISLHLPASAGLYLGPKELKALAKRDGPIAIINTSRESLVDHQALFEAMREKPDLYYFSDIDLTKKDDQGIAHPIQILEDLRKKFPSRAFLANHLGASTPDAEKGVEEATILSLQELLSVFSGQKTFQEAALDFVVPPSRSEVRNQVKHLFRDWRFLAAGGVFATGALAKIIFNQLLPLKSVGIQTPVFLTQEIFNLPMFYVGLVFGEHQLHLNQHILAESIFGKALFWITSFLTSVFIFGMFYRMARTMKTVKVSFAGILAWLFVGALFSHTAEHTARLSVTNWWLVSGDNYGVVMNLEDFVMLFTLPVLFVTLILRSILSFSNNIRQLSAQPLQQNKNRNREPASEPPSAKVSRSEMRTQEPDAELWNARYTAAEIKRFKEQAQFLRKIYKKLNAEEREILMYPNLLLVLMGVKPVYMRYKGEPDHTKLFAKMDKMMPDWHMEIPSLILYNDSMAFSPQFAPRLIERHDGKLAIEKLGLFESGDLPLVKQIEESLQSDEDDAPFKPAADLLDRLWQRTEADAEARKRLAGFLSGYPVDAIQDYAAFEPKERIRYQSGFYKLSFAAHKKTEAHIHLIQRWAEILIYTYFYFRDLKNYLEIARGYIHQGELTKKQHDILLGDRDVKELEPGSPQSWDDFGETSYSVPDGKNGILYSYDAKFFTRAPFESAWLFSSDLAAFLAPKGEFTLGEPGQDFDREGKYTITLEFSDEVYHFEVFPKGQPENIIAKGTLISRSEVRQGLRKFAVAEASAPARAEVRSPRFDRDDEGRVLMIRATGQRFMIGPRIILRVDEILPDQIRFNLRSLRGIPVTVSEGASLEEISSVRALYTVTVPLEKGEIKIGNAISITTAGRNTEPQFPRHANLLVKAPEEMAVDRDIVFYNKYGRQLKELGLFDAAITKALNYTENAEILVKVVEAAQRHGLLWKQDLYSYSYNIPDLQDWVDEIDAHPQVMNRIEAQFESMGIVRELAASVKPKQKLSRGALLYWARMYRYKMPIKDIARAIGDGLTPAEHARQEVRMKPERFQEFFNGLTGWIGADEPERRHKTIFYDSDSILIGSWRNGGWSIDIQSETNGNLFMSWTSSETGDFKFRVNHIEIPGFESKDPLFHIGFDPDHPEMYMVFDEQAEGPVKRILENQLSTPGSEENGRGPVGYQIEFSFDENWRGTSFEHIRFRKYAWQINLDYNPEFISESKFITAFSQYLQLQGEPERLDSLIGQIDSVNEDFSIRFTEATAEGIKFEIYTSNLETMVAKGSLVERSEKGSIPVLWEKELTGVSDLLAGITRYLFEEIRDFPDWGKSSLLFIERKPDLELIEAQIESSYESSDYQSAAWWQLLAAAHTIKKNYLAGIDVSQTAQQVSRLYGLAARNFTQGDNIRPAIHQDHLNGLIQLSHPDKAQQLVSLMYQKYRSEVRMPSSKQIGTDMIRIIKSAQERALKIKNSNVASKEISQLTEHAANVLNKFQEELDTRRLDKRGLIEKFKTEGLEPVLDTIIKKIRSLSRKYRTSLPKVEKKKISAKRIEMASRRFLREELKAFLQNPENENRDLVQIAVAFTQRQLMLQLAVELTLLKAFFDAFGGDDDFDGDDFDGLDFRSEARHLDEASEEFKRFLDSIYPINDSESFYMFLLKMLWGKYDQVPREQLAQYLHDEAGVLDIAYVNRTRFALAVSSVVGERYIGFPSALIAVFTYFSDRLPTEVMEEFLSTYHTDVFPPSGQEILGLFPEDTRVGKLIDMLRWLGANPHLQKIKFEFTPEETNKIALTRRDKDGKESSVFIPLPRFQGKAVRAAYDSFALALKITAGLPEYTYDPNHDEIYTQEFEFAMGNVLGFDLKNLLITFTGQGENPERIEIEIKRDEDNEWGDRNVQRSEMRIAAAGSAAQWLREGVSFEDYLEQAGIEVGTLVAVMKVAEDTVPMELSQKAAEEALRAARAEASDEQKADDAKFSKMQKAFFASLRQSGYGWIVDKIESGNQPIRLVIPVERRIDDASLQMIGLLSRADSIDLIITGESKSEIRVQRASNVQIHSVNSVKEMQRLSQRLLSGNIYHQIRGMAGYDDTQLKQVTGIRGVYPVKTRSALLKRQPGLLAILVKAYLLDKAQAATMGQILELDGWLNAHNFDAGEFAAAMLDAMKATQQSA